MTGRRRVLNDEQVAYFREIVPGRSVKEIIAMLREKYGLVLNAEQIHTLKSKYNLRSGRVTPPNRLTTPEQDKWIKANAQGKTGVELQKMIKDKFGIEFTLPQIKSYKARKKINTGLTGHFVKGCIPLNKGKKVSPEVYERCKPTMFKKSQRPLNWKPVGSERVNVDGYIEIKVKEPNIWRPKHRVVWEQHHGAIPKNKRIIFKDRNRLHCSIDNLMIISGAELSAMNHSKLFNTNPEITEVGVTLAKVICASNARRKKR